MVYHVRAIRISVSDFCTRGIRFGKRLPANVAVITSFRLSCRAGKRTYTFLMGKPGPAKLANFPEVEVFVLVADPEGLVLDSRDYYAPLITPWEAHLAFTPGAAWTGEYRTDFACLLVSSHHRTSNSWTPGSPQASLCCPLCWEICTTNLHFLGASDVEMHFSARAPELRMTSWPSIQWMHTRCLDMFNRILEPPIAVHQGPSSPFLPASVDGTDISNSEVPGSAG